MGNDFDRTARNDDEDQPAHPVTLSDFYLQETEVTNAEMMAYFIANRVDVADRPARWKAAWERIEKNGHDPARYPAVGIPHDLAERYAQWVGGALPTEAQWEYAARSRGKPNPYVWGSEPVPDSKLANVDSLGLIGQIPTSEVGKYPRDRTEQGVLDLTGNVREWCRDVWTRYVASTEAIEDPHDPAASTVGAGPSVFVVRGGSFAFWKDKTRTTRPRRPESSDLTAENLAQDGSADDLGFRVVLEWPR
jgi:serine/threonine-protein kinase